MNIQLRLFEPKAEPPAPKAPALTDPTPVGEYMSIHGLIYSLEPVEGWLEVTLLMVYRPPDKRIVADRAWVDPDTVGWALLKEYPKFKFAGPMAWGFGPVVKVARHQNEMGSFDFADPADYTWIGEILARKREEHNRNFDLRQKEARESDR